MRCFAMLFLISACARSSGPRVEIWKDGAYAPCVLRSHELSGRRVGAVTQAAASFELESGEHLRMELDIAYDPTPSLGEGHWEIDGDRAAAGEVRAESVQFLGGQGEGPSVGGRFLLEENGAPRFRVVLPVQPVAQTDWGR
jgi:hypothetical protein